MPTAVCEECKTEKSYGQFRWVSSLLNLCNDCFLASYNQPTGRVVFVLFPNQGPHRRVFSVPAIELIEELPALLALDDRADLAFNESDNPTLLSIGQRLGVADGWDGTRSLRHHESDASVRKELGSLLLFGTCN